MRYDYEHLLKCIYGIKNGNRDSHLTHGAQPEIYANAQNSQWSFEEIDEEIAKRKDGGDALNIKLPTFQSAFSAGRSVARLIVYLSEAIQYAVEYQCRYDTERKNKLEELYRRTINAKSIKDIDEVIIEIYPILDLDTYTI